MKPQKLLLTFFLFTTFISGAQIIHVPGNYLTIQDGINAATTGDTVLVADGNYLENINFNGKAITVASEFIMDGDTNHINNTVIDGSQPANPDYGSVVTFITGEDTTSVLCGFTITGGTGTFLAADNIRFGGGIVCYYAGAKLVSNKIYGNQVNNISKAGGGGISAISYDDSKWIVIESNKIYDNLASTSETNSFGGGISCATSARICNNQILHNHSKSSLESGAAYSGGLDIETVSEVDEVIVQNNVISKNKTEAYWCFGGGIYQYQSALELSNNMVNENINIGTYCYGSAIYLENISGDITIENNTINDNTYNTTNVAGATIMVWDVLDPQALLVINNNKICNNTAGGSGTNVWGTAIWLRDLENFEVIVNANFIKNNTGRTSGGFYARNSYNYILTNNVFQGNEAATFGGALFEMQKYSKTDEIIPLNKSKSNCYKISRNDRIHPLVANNIFIENHSDDLGGAVYLSSTFDSLCPVFINNIFKDNTADGMDYDIHHAGDEQLLISNNNINSSRIFGNWDGTGNIVGDPDFLNDTLFNIDDSSPCFNAGVDSVFLDERWYTCPSFDFENDPRPSYGGVDIGADEYFVVGIGTHFSNTPKIALLSYPNPFSTSTTIEYQLEKPTKIKLEIYNHFGEQVEQITDYQPQGKHQFTWHAENLPAGIYYCVLKTEYGTQTTKMIKLK
jgi:hypothetical protein